MKLIYILVISWIAIATLLIIDLSFYPETSNMIIAVGTVLMAFATFLMAYFTYTSYSSLANFQKASLEPALSIKLWKEDMHGQKGIDGYGVTIKNDGHGIAKKVMLWFNWAIKEMKEKDG
jgi:hypothetical protein